MPVITVKGTRASVSDLVRQIARGLAGKDGDRYGVCRDIQLLIGTAALAKIKQDFVTKARGGTGEDGIKWQPLAPSTIARRRQGPADKKAVTLKARASASVSKADQARIAKDIKRRTADLMVRFNLPYGQASGLARAQAEAAHRRAGRIASKFSILSARSVEILRDTGELLNAFSPGVHAQQILNAEPGMVVVGTNKKGWHHKGARNLPARPYWPSDGNLPQTWWDAIHDAARRGIAEIVMRLAASR